jgi:choline dehydrogenase-like flavoprotein
LGGGSSINAMIWARGHKSDWDFFASETGDPAWGYESVLDTYCRIEDWQGAPDPRHRGTGGPVFVQPLQNPSPAAPALFEKIRSLGIEIFENQNGRIMEADGGASVPDLRIRDGKRQSVFRAYVFPQMDQPNLTVLPHALVTRLTFEDGRATGVQISYEGSVRRIRARREVILSLGAIHTPKVLMQSGIGDQTELRRLGNSSSLRPFVGREIIPNNLEHPELENYIRDTAFSFWHQTSTAKMGQHAMCVVDGYLKVYGVDNLRVADGSIMPRVTTGNTMAPCVIIGEQAAQILRIEHKL